MERKKIEKRIYSFRNDIGFDGNYNSCIADNT